MKKGLNRPLRKGYTTGACAAAAAKAAVILMLKGQGARVKGQKTPAFVEIPFPDGSRVKFRIHASKLATRNSQLLARASVIKDAGDDPDITNGAEIVAEAALGSRVKGQGSRRKIDLPHAPCSMPLIQIKGGKGVGVVTKPGLAVPVGSPAINPVPMKMIREAVMEAIKEGSRVKGQKEKGQGSRVKGQGSRRKIDLPHAPCSMPLIQIKGGKGVGVVTKPGLAVPVGSPAINPVPMKMIREAVMEAIKEGSRVKGQKEKGQGSRVKGQEVLEITISVPKGKELAKKTLNSRLGIIGGISILGTTGIVEPMSVDAYTETISLGIDMAVAAGLNEVVFTPGRNSEKYAEEILRLKEEAFVQMGDYAGFAFKTAVKKGIKKIDVVGQLGKMAKIADGNFKTHVRDSMLDLSHIAKWAEEWGYDKAISKSIKQSNTA
ncbi:MAG: hypothetical protein A2Z50_06905, partial [Nitrospirae bacterium RBG_19FT_COMBO_42_15]